MRFNHQPTVYGSRQAKGGYRSDIGLYVRSSWEANFARYLNYMKDEGNVYRWRYEPEVFIFHRVKKGTRAYVPDFKVWDYEGARPNYYEIKGYMDAKSKIKLKRMSLYYPEIDIEIIDSETYKKINRWARDRIAHWEE